MTFKEKLGHEARHKIWLLYLRKSRQDDPNETVEEVLAKHEAQLQEWAERELGQRIPPENIYREIVSGESIEARQEIKKVLARLEDPNVAGVIVIEPSRLSRGDLADCSKIIDSFRFSRSLVATPYMTYDLENKMERKFFKDELLRGNDFLEYTKEILYRGRVAAVKRGCFIGRTAPYGYRKTKVGKDHTLEIFEEEAEVVRLAYNLYVNEGITPGRIANRLNEMGARTSGGYKWKKDPVRVMLRNPHYAGFVAFGQRKTTPVLENGKVVYKRLAQPEEEQIIAEGKHTAIVPRDVWEAAQGIIAKNPRNNQFTQLANPLGSLMFCKKCGYAMRMQPYSHTVDRYRCKQSPMCYKSVKVQTVLDALIVALEEAELPALELKVTNGEGDARKIQQRLLAKLEKQMEEYRAQEERQYDLLETNPNYPQDVFERRNKALRAKMDDCQAAIYKAKSALPQSVDFAERVVALKNAIAILKNENATPEEQHRVLKAIVARIDFSGVPSAAETNKRCANDQESPFELGITLRL